MLLILQKIQRYSDQQAFKEFYQHMIYLYNYAGEPWKTQYWVRETMDKLCLATPDGYCGDEDNGQTSAW